MALYDRVESVFQFQDGMLHHVLIAHDATIDSWCVLEETGETFETFEDARNEVQLLPAAITIAELQQKDLGADMEIRGATVARQGYNALIAHLQIEAQKEAAKHP